MNVHVILMQEPCCRANSCKISVLVYVLPKQALYFSCFLTLDVELVTYFEPLKPHHLASHPPLPLCGPEQAN